MSKRQATLWVAICAAIAAGCFAVAMVRAAVPSASSSVDIPISGSIKDDAGASWTINGTVKVTKTEPEPPPVPIPGTITFGAVTDLQNNVLTQSTSIKPLILTGTGFPTSGPSSNLRLALAGQSMNVTNWTATQVSFSIPKTVTDHLSQPLAGMFEVFQQISGNWKSLGKGGQFVILPSQPAPAGTGLPAVDQVLPGTDTVPVGEPITLMGRNFGAVKGKLFVSGLQVEPIAWSDTRITFKFDGANRAHRIWLQIVRADGVTQTVGGGSESRPPLLPFVVLPGE